MAPSPPSVPTSRFQGLHPSPETGKLRNGFCALGAAAIDLKESYGQKAAPNAMAADNN
jgi:hypothetical protein